MAARTQPPRQKVLIGANLVRQNAGLLEAVDQRASHRISRRMGIVKTGRDISRVDEEHGRGACRVAGRNMKGLGSYLGKRRDSAAAPFHAVLTFILYHVHEK